MTVKSIDELLALMAEADASDLHLKVERPPMIRVHGVLRVMEAPTLDEEDMRRLQSEMLTPVQVERLEREHELDASYQPASVHDRFRVNCFFRMGLPGVVMRRVPRAVPSLDDLGFRSTLKKLVHNEQGLVLLTGPTGSGKSTTLAAMIRELNETEPLHVITIEDPIEFVQDDGTCVINQREVGTDTDSFSEALRRALRQDPDVIMVGEMRDAETMRIATMAAETGHLVLSTLHTNDAKQTVDRIVNTFPPEEQRQVRIKLASALRGVVSQSLIPRREGSGRVCVQEILVCTPYIRELIKNGEVSRLDAAIREAAANYGMQSMNESLFKAWRSGDITNWDALAFSNRPTDLELLIRTEEFERAGSLAPPEPASEGQEPGDVATAVHE
jgi:twitching motility protein PilT